MYLIYLLVSGSKTSTLNVFWYVHMWNRLNIIVRYMSCAFEQSPRLLAQLAWFNSNYLRICLASWILHVKIFWRNCHHINITCTKKNNNVGSQQLYCKQKVHITVEFTKLHQSVRKWFQYTLFLITTFFEICQNIKNMLRTYSRLREEQFFFHCFYLPKSRKSE